MLAGKSFADDLNRLGAIRVSEDGISFGGFKKRRNRRFAVAARKGRNWQDQDRQETQNR
jgi:hypothetical protein